MPSQRILMRMWSAYVAFALTLGSTTALATYDDGLKAYQAGNIATAAQEWRQSAQAGDPRAQFRLGQMYEQGRGVVQNRVQAHLWYNLAAAQGNEEAAQARDRLTKTMTPDEQAEAQRMALAWHPVDTKTAPSNTAQASTGTTTTAPAPTARDLYKAAEAGDVAKIRDLIGHGINVNEPDADGWTAIFYAAAKGQTDAVKALIDAKADVNAKGNRDGETPLMVAALGGYPDVVKMLLGAGADKGAKDNKGRTASDLSKMKGGRSVASLLGSPPNASPIGIAHAAQQARRQSSSEDTTSADCSDQAARKELNIYSQLVQKETNLLANSGNSAEVCTVRKAEVAMNKRDLAWAEKCGMSGDWRAIAHVARTGLDGKKGSNICY